MAISGGTVMVGAPAHWPPPHPTPTVHAFRLAGSTWEKYGQLTASDPQLGVGTWFGFSLAMDGDVAVVGAVGHDSGPLIDAGAAYVFEYDATDDAWTETAKLTASDPAAYDYYGKVAVDGNVIVVGAQFDDDAGTDSGSAYVYRRDGAAWVEEAKLTASDGASPDQFGLAAAVGGGTVIVGSPFADAPESKSGAAYVYVFDDVGPVTSDVAAIPNPVPVESESALTAIVDDTLTGNSAVASAEYTLDGWTTSHPMAAQDGALDSPTEVVAAALTSPTLPGVYDLCVSGTDQAGNIGDEECTFYVVYDPDGGFVTGGGWIDSPPGAYIDDPEMTGKATFGFVAKYKKGRTVPDGQTEFLFHAGDLNFHSTSYEWLVVTGGDYARFKGSGSINGTDGYKFLIWAGDSVPDTFRIKVWTEDAGVETVVYDNGMNQALGGGNIVVHTKH